MKKEPVVTPIPRKELLEVRRYVKKIRRWHETLYFMEHFLASKKPRNPQDLKACKEIFEVVYLSLGELLTETTQCLNSMLNKKNR